MEWSLHHVDQLVFPFCQYEGKTFDNYYAGVNAPIVQQIKDLVHNPTTRQIYLSGEKACGKSHLLHATCRQAEESYKRCAYLALSDCIGDDDVIADDALSGLKQFDLVCLDDIDALSGHLHWQKAVFNLINEVRHVGNILILAGRRPPFVPLEFADLTSRLVWGSVYRLKALPDEEKIIAIQFIAKRHGLQCPESTLHYLFSHHTRDLGQLIALTDKLVQCAGFEKSILTIPFVKQVLESEQALVK